MSRIGKKAVAVPADVKVTLRDHGVTTSGPKGELSWTYPQEVAVEYDAEAAEIRVTRSGDDSRSKAMQGLSRALIANMVTGVVKGFQKKLEVYGTGYGCQVKGNRLLLNCGYMGRAIDASGKQKEAQFNIAIPEGVTVTVEVPSARGDTDPAKMTVSGPDKQKVGQFASEVRALRTPEPYKGKGIRYSDEHVRRKQGKAFAGGG